MVGFIFTVFGIKVNFDHHFQHHWNLDVHRPTLSTYKALQGVWQSTNMCILIYIVSFENNYSLSISKISVILFQLIVLMQLKIWLWIHAIGCKHILSTSIIIAKHEYVYISSWIMWLPAGIKKQVTLRLCKGRRNGVDGFVH